MAEEAEDAFDKLKAGSKAVAKKVTDPSKDLGDEYNTAKGKERAGGIEQTDESGLSSSSSDLNLEVHSLQLKLTSSGGHV